MERARDAAVFFHVLESDRHALFLNWVIDHEMDVTGQAVPNATHLRQFVSRPAEVRLGYTAGAGARAPSKHGWVTFPKRLRAGAVIDCVINAVKAIIQPSILSLSLIPWLNGAEVQHSAGGTPQPA